MILINFFIKEDFEIEKNSILNKDDFVQELFVIDDFEIDFLKKEKRYFEINILQKKKFVKKMLRISCVYC